MRILITGGQGQLAMELARTFYQDQVTSRSHGQLDITDWLQVREELERSDPEVVINTAAYHQVDLCESEPEQSFLINAAAPQRLAAECSRRGILFVHISTDYVFGGRQTIPYLEHSPVDPLNVYGASKAAGEMAIRATTEDALIIRTTGLYGPAGRTTRRGNFVETMLRLAGAGKPISVVADQIMTPSYTVDVAVSLAVLAHGGFTGTFHLTNTGSCSWYEFAAEIFHLTGVDADLRKVSQNERPMPARRPAYSVLSHDRLLAAGLPDLPPWQEALRAYLSTENDQAAQS